MTAIVIKNADQVKQAVGANITKIEKAAGFATGMAALALERQIKLNANTGVHPRGQGHLKGTGPGPNRVTGNLIRSVVTEIRQGFGSYVATVGPTAEYARALEFGNPNWKSGVRYPYLVPAVGQMVGSGKLNRVFQGAFLSAYRGS